MLRLPQVCAYAYKNYHKRFVEFFAVPHFSLFVKVQRLLKSILEKKKLIWLSISILQVKHKKYGLKYWQ
jgi:hypothetical protein